MAKTNEELSNKLVAQGAKMTPLALKDEASTWFTKNEKGLIDLMGGKSQARRLFAICMDTISRNPKLLESDRRSLFMAIAQCGQFRLYPGAMQQCAIVPYFDKKSGKTLAQFQFQYQGILDLAYRAGTIVPPTICEVVWEADEFSYQKGDAPRIFHVPSELPEDKRGDRRGVYVVLTTKRRDKVREFYTAATILRYKAMSKSAQYGESFWNSPNCDTVSWMWRKTALKQSLKLIPKSIDLANALEIENQQDDPEAEKAPITDLNIPLAKDESESPADILAEIEREQEQLNI